MKEIHTCQISYLWSSIWFSWPFCHPSGCCRFFSCVQFLAGSWWKEGGTHFRSGICAIGAGHDFIVQRTLPGRIHRSGRMVLRHLGEIL